MDPHRLSEQHPQQIPDPIMEWVEATLGNKDDVVPFTKMEHTLARVIYNQEKEITLLREQIESLQSDRTEKEGLYDVSALDKAEEVSQTGHWEFNPVTGEIHASEGALRIYGIRPEEISFQTGWALALPEYRPIFETTMRSLMEEAGIHKLDYKITRKNDGKILDIQTIAEYDPKRKVIFGSLMDITERKQIEEALIKSEEHYRFLFDYSSIAIWEMDLSEVRGFFDTLRNNGVSDFPAFFKNNPDTIQYCANISKILDINRKSVEILKAKNKEDIFHKISTCFIDETYQVYQQILIALAEGQKPVEMVIPICTFTGEKILLASSYFIMPGYEIPLSKVVVSFINVTKRIESEEKNAQLLDQLFRQNEEQKEVISLAASLRHAQTLAEVQNIITQQTMDIFRAEAAALMLSQEGSFHVASGMGKWETMTGRSHPGQIAEFQQILETGQSKYFPVDPDIPTGMENSPGGPDRDFMNGLKGTMIAPLIVGDVPIGLLLVGFYAENNSFCEQTNLLTTIAEIAGITIQKMRTTSLMEQVIARRTGELTALYNVISVAGQPWDIYYRLDSALEQVLLSLNCQSGGIFFVDADERLKVMVGKNMPEVWKNVLDGSALDNTWEGWVIEHAEPLIIPDVFADPRCILPFETKKFVYIGVPILIREKPAGVVSILREGEQIFSIDEITFITALVNHIGVIIENAGLIEQAEKAVLLEERSRLARDLHDSVVQTLYSASLFSEAARDFAEQGNFALVKEHLGRLSQITRQTLLEMRLLVYELRPPVLVQEGLVMALSQRLEMVENRLAIRTRLTNNLLVKLSNSIEEALYWIAIEALNNITRHAQAHEINLDIFVDRYKVKLTVQDDGIGFDLDDPSIQKGMGIKDMQERLIKENGSFVIRSAPGEGTTLIATLPL